ncbi:hypothetical protein D918_07171 [Trichuris suis]|nr:hypothetical protein D918_07171 [Trichuris suis]
MMRAEKDNLDDKMLPAENDKRVLDAILEEETPSDGSSRPEETQAAQIIGNAFSSGLYVPGVFSDGENTPENRERTNSTHTAYVKHQTIAYPQNTGQAIMEGVSDLLFWKSKTSSLAALSMGVMLVLVLGEISLLCFLGYLCLFNIGFCLLIRSAVGLDEELPDYHTAEEVSNVEVLEQADVEFVNSSILFFEQTYKSVVHNLLHGEIKFLFKWICLLFFSAVVCIEAPQHWIRVFGLIVLFTLPYGMKRFNISFERVFEETWEFCLIGWSLGGAMAFVIGKLLSVIANYMQRKVNSN